MNTLSQKNETSPKKEIALDRLQHKYTHGQDFVSTEQIAECISEHLQEEYLYNHCFQE